MYNFNFSATPSKGGGRPSLSDNMNIGGDC